MKIAILGLPMSGKTTILKCLINKTNQNSPKPNVFRIMKTPNSSLEQLSKMSSSVKTSFAEIEVMDFENTQPFNDSSEYFTEEIITSLQEFDAIMLVIRAFGDPTVPHPFGEVDPNRDLEQFLLEQRFSDINVIEKRVKRIHSEIKLANKKNQAYLKDQLSVLETLKLEIEESSSFDIIKSNEKYKKIIQETFFLSSIPTTVIFNIDEHYHEDEFSDISSGDAKTAWLYGKLEEELLLINKKDAEEIRQDLKIDDFSIMSLVNQVLKQNRIIHFLTTGKKESKSWQIKSGTTAVESAHKIHSDLSRGFIRAEVIHYTDLIKSGGFVQARKKGILRTEGKDYIVKNGDVINFLFSV